MHKLFAPLIFACCSLFYLPLFAEEPPETPAENTAEVPEAMNNQRLGELIQKIDPKAQGRLGRWSLSVQGHQLLVLTDERADRMRIMVQVADAETVDKPLLYRMMQANFDTALDARYAIAHGQVWGTYIHPLSPLTDDEFYSGVVQTLNLSATYGEAFSSNVIQFGGGDTAEKQREQQRKAEKGERTL